MSYSRAFGFGAKMLIFLAAFVIVILYNAYVSPEISGNLMFFWRSGDYVSLIIILAETFVIGAILRALLMWAFRAQFLRKRGGVKNA